MAQAVHQLAIPVVTKHNLIITAVVTGIIQSS